MVSGTTDDHAHTADRDRQLRECVCVIRRRTLRKVNQICQKYFENDEREREVCSDEERSRLNDKDRKLLVNGDPATRIIYKIVRHWPMGVVFK